jgi:ferritin-like metal-binding protein YciE
VTLQDLLVGELENLHDAERQLTTMLPAMAEAANGDALRAALSSHGEEARAQIDRLEEIFQAL